MIAKLSIKVDEVGRGSIFLDGVDISNKVSALTISSEVGELTTVKITMPASCAVDALADIQLSISPLWDEISKEMRRMLYSDAAKEDETRL